jgi:hypothetical protein
MMRESGRGARERWCSLTAAKAWIQIVPKQFAASDEQALVHTPKVTNLDGGPPPSQVTSGRTVELKMSAVLPTGQGRLMWVPMTSGRSLVQWDFDVEID